MSETTLLQVNDLRTSFFTDSGEVKAVNGLSFSLERGKVLGIVGESGSGKSVTAYSLLRILTDSGRVTGGQVLALAGMEIAVLHTPGHSRGGVCYILPENQGMFCGDTLFFQGYGRHDFGDGDFSELKQSLRKLMNYHPKVIAYPGHGKSTFAGK